MRRSHSGRSKAHPIPDSRVGTDDYDEETVEDIDEQDASDDDLAGTIANLISSILEEFRAEALPFFSTLCQIFADMMVWYI